MLTAVEIWLKAEPSVEAAILFGSSARQSSEPAPADGRSDLDLHIVTTAPAALERVDWARALPGQRLCMQVVRPATGGVRKVTAMFAAGEVDLVLVPASRLRLGRLAMRLGLHRGRPALSIALNEIATCLRSGYRFLKGEKSWGSFYARIVAEMPGVRLGDSEARVLADVFLCDLLWVLRKLERGELSAAQHLLHRSLAETNFRLLRELRLRRGQPLPSFGLGRRVEALLPAGELAWVKVDARREQVELRLAAGTALKGLQALMKELVPSWAVPTEMNLLLAPHLSPGN